MVWFHSFLCRADKKEEGHLNIHHEADFVLPSNASAKGNSSCLLSIMSRRQLDSYEISNFWY